MNASIATMRRQTYDTLLGHMCADAAALVCAYRGMDPAYVIFFDSHAPRGAAEHYRVDEWIDRGLVDLVAAHMQLFNIPSDASGAIRPEWRDDRTRTLIAAMDAANPRAIAHAAIESPNFARFVGRMKVQSAPAAIAAAAARLVIRVGGFNAGYAWPSYAQRFGAYSNMRNGIYGFIDRARYLGDLKHLRALARYDARYAPLAAMLGQWEFSLQWGT